MQVFLKYICVNHEDYYTATDVCNKLFLSQQPGSGLISLESPAKVKINNKQLKSVLNRKSKLIYVNILYISMRKILNKIKIQRPKK